MRTLILIIIQLRNPVETGAPTILAQSIKRAGDQEPERPVLRGESCGLCVHQVTE
jgi:hypothetical protein